MRMDKEEGCCSFQGNDRPGSLTGASVLFDRVAPAQHASLEENILLPWAKVKNAEVALLRRGVD